MARKYIRRPFPAHALQEALQVAQAIQDCNNGQPLNRVLLANAVNRKPASSEFQALLSSSGKYGLTIGNEKSPVIALTDIGTSATKPRDPGERASALKRAALQPDVFRLLYERYNNGKLPQGQFFLSMLERDFNVPRERVQECSDVVARNGQFAGIIREFQGTPYVILESADPDPGSTTAGAVHQEGEANPSERVADAASEPTEESPPASQQPRERHIFLGHGKNRKPLEQLEQVLRQFEIRYKVAIEEPQMARPISVKVAQTMRECHSAILIFTADEEFRTQDGGVIRRPSENAIYELGAASVLYENRIVIFKEEGIEFPANFRDIGYITFEKDKLDAKGLELIKELIGLGLVKVQPA